MPAGQGRCLRGDPDVSKQPRGLQRRRRIPIAVDFDSTPTGTNIAGSALGGVTFSSPNLNGLDVVDGASTFTPAGFSGVIDANTNRLLPTSGLNVLSPGGLALVPGSALAEMDSLRLDFNAPLSAFGIDILFQSLDFFPFMSYQVFNASLILVASGSVDTSYAGGGGSPGGAHFIGFVSDDASTNISRIVFTEDDGNAVFPDANVGYDTLRFAVPEPTSWMFTAIGLAGLLARRYFRA